METIHIQKPKGRPVPDVFRKWPELLCTVHTKTINKGYQWQWHVQCPDPDCQKHHWLALLQVTEHPTCYSGICWKTQTNYKCCRIVKYLLGQIRERITTNAR